MPESTDIAEPTNSFVLELKGGEVHITSKTEELKDEHQDRELKELCVLMARAKRNVVFHMASVRKMSSSLLYPFGILLNIERGAKKVISMEDICDDVLELFRITGLERWMRINRPKEESPPPNSFTLEYKQPRVHITSKERVLLEQLHTREFEELSSLAADAYRDMVINLQSAEYVSSALMGRTIQLHQELTRMGKRACLENVHPEVHASYKLTTWDEKMLINKTINGEPIQGPPRAPHPEL